MKTLRWDDAESAHFTIADVPPRYHAALVELAYRQGPHGFERSFPLGTARLDEAFENFTSSAETIVRQTARELPVRWKQTLAVTVDLLVEGGIDWFLVGSTALAARGIEVAVRDIDLVIDEASVSAIDELFSQGLIEPTTRNDVWIARWFGRAFLGARVEWVAGVRESVDDRALSDYGPAAQSRLEEVTWNGYSLRVPPIDLQLQVTRRRELNERADAIERYLALHDYQS